MTVLSTTWKKDPLGLESPYKDLQVQIKPRFFRQHTFLESLVSNPAWCRLLIFWSVVTTLASVVSISYAIDAQNRLNEARKIQSDLEKLIPEKSECLVIRNELERKKKEPSLL